MPGAWRAAHRRLYQYLSDNTHEGEQPSLEDSSTALPSVAHGCQAGLQQEAYDNVYVKRIIRVNQYYSIQYLGAFGSDLAAVANFFAEPWHRFCHCSERVPNQCC